VTIPQSKFTYITHRSYTDAAADCGEGEGGGDQGAGIDVAGATGYGEETAEWAQRIVDKFRPSQRRSAKPVSRVLTA